MQDAGGEPATGRSPTALSARSASVNPTLKVQSRERSEDGPPRAFLDQEEAGAARGRTEPPSPPPAPSSPLLGQEGARAAPELERAASGVEGAAPSTLGALLGAPSATEASLSGADGPPTISASTLREAGGSEGAEGLQDAGGEPAIGRSPKADGVFSPGLSAGPSEGKGSNVSDGAKGAAREDECVICWEVLSQIC